MTTNNNDETMQVTTSPWGPVQHTERVADGIVFVSTASHGGFVLSPKRLMEMRARFKRNPYGRSRYFEEDCRAALVVIAFPELFRADQVDRAQACARVHYPQLAD